MCGIWGKFYFDINKNVSSDLAQKMNKALFHRGPDQGGAVILDNVALGAQRLSILDITAGRQPISNEDQSIWTVLNGEIYNYKELRQGLVGKGHVFSSQGDAEILPHLYEEYGENFLDQLKGMFAFAIWDRRNRRLMIARDRFGIKPLFFMQNKHFLIFASEMKAILQDQEVNQKLDVRGLNCYLSYNYLPSSYTMNQDIKKLLPGYYLIYKNNATVQIKKYWQLKSEERFEPAKEIESRLESLLDVSIRQHLNIDVPWGLFLSGGLDSATLLYLIKRYFTEVDTFNLSFQEQTYAEGEFASYTGKYFGAVHRQTILDQKQCRDQLLKIVDGLDNPIGEFSVIPSFFLANFASGYIKVAISGEGADELLCGYSTYQADILAQYYRLLPRSAKQAAKFLAAKLPEQNKYLTLAYKTKLFTRMATRPYQLVHYSWREIFSQEEKEKLFTSSYLCHLKDGYLSEPENIYLSFFNEICSSENYLKKCQYTDLKLLLPDNILYRADNTGMANSIETRFPYLDHSLAEFLFNLPLKYKIRYMRTKYLLRKTMRGKIPSVIIKRKKHGFAAPLDQWLKAELKDLFLEFVCETEVKKNGIFNWDFIQRLFQEHSINKANHGRKLWNLMILFIWMNNLKKGPLSQ